MMKTYRSTPRARYRNGLLVAGHRDLPEEVAVAISYNGSTQAVMMATPQDLEDFARGFTLTEAIARPEEITSITVVEVANGIDLQIWLDPSANARLEARRRSMAGPVGCGLCGIDSLDEALRAPPVVPGSSLRLRPVEICAAIAELPGRQALREATHAVHAAAFWTQDAGILAVREDVGRHNALDKLVGALAGSGPTGAVLLTSRVSIDMVQKVAAFGAPVMIAAAAPTSHAVALADAAGITLVASARPDGFDIFTHPERILAGEASDVA